VKDLSRNLERNGGEIVGSGPIKRGRKSYDSPSNSKWQRGPRDPKRTHGTQRKGGEDVLIGGKKNRGVGERKADQLWKRRIRIVEKGHGQGLVKNGETLDGEKEISEKT